MPSPSNCITWKNLAIVWYGIGYNEPEARFILAHFLHQPKRFDKVCPFSFSPQGHGINFIPMVWGAGANHLDRAVEDGLPREKRALLGFNEPNFPECLDRFEVLVFSSPDCVICVIWE